MHIRKGKAPGSGRLARIGVELSRGARVRLAWMDFYRGCDNVAHTCRHFGISRQTFYRWQRRYDPYDLTTLEEHSPRPRRGFPLGRAASAHPRHSSNRHSVPRHLAAPHALSYPGGADRRRSRVRRRVRTGLPAAGPPSVRLAPTLSQTQRCCRTRQSHPHRGVLPGNRLLPGDEKTQSRTTPLGENLQYRPPSSGAGLLNPTPVPQTELISTERMKVSPIHWTSTIS